MYPDENVPHIFCVQERTNCVLFVVQFSGIYGISVKWR